MDFASPLTKCLEIIYDYSLANHISYSICDLADFADPTVLQPHTFFGKSFSPCCCEVL